MAKDPIIAALERDGSAYAEGVGSLGRLLRRYRLELSCLVLAGGAYAGLYVATHRNAVGAGVLLGVGLAFLSRVPMARRALRRGLRTARIRRRWDEAVEHTGFKRPIPLSKVDPIAGGHRGRVRVSHGVSFEDLSRQAERLAAHLGVRELRVKRDPHNASTGTVTLVRNDPLLMRGGEAWPAAEGLPRRPHPRRPRRDPDDHEGGWFGRGGGPPDLPPMLPEGGASLWRAIPVGQDEHGDVVSVALPERSMLLGGSPGSGKSVAISMLLATAAMDPTAHVYLVDGKMVEFAEWEDVADGFAHSISDAILLLYHLQQVMEDRYRALRAEGLRKVTEKMAERFPLHVLFIDELALFTAGTEPKSSREFTSVLTDIVARCRAAGVIVVAATQKPEGQVVSTNLRDLFAYRWAMRCGTPEASDTILGRGYAAKGFNATNIAPGQPGVGYLLAEDGVPVKNRSYHVTDEHVYACAEVARELRARN